MSDVYKIKPFPWKASIGGWHLDIADLPFGGFICITTDEAGKFHSRAICGCEYPIGDVQHDTAEAAKHAAEEWYRSKLLTALEPVEQQ